MNTEDKNWYSGRSATWTQGYVDGQNGREPDEQLTAREECFDDYYDGYNAGKATRKQPQ